MTLTVRKTAKGAIVEQDGFSDGYKAYVQGARQFKIFVPDALIAKEGSAENAADYILSNWLGFPRCGARILRNERVQ